ncbi:MAG: EB domain-containing protein [Pseudomonadota bacterium]
MKRIHLCLLVLLVAGLASMAACSGGGDGSEGANSSVSADVANCTDTGGQFQTDGTCLCSDSQPPAADGSCSCPDGEELVGTTCMADCATGQYRDTTDLTCKTSVAAGCTGGTVQSDGSCQCPAGMQPTMGVCKTTNAAATPPKPVEITAAYFNSKCVLSTDGCGGTLTAKYFTGTKNYEWDIIKGAMPPGISLTDTGTKQASVTGKPTAMSPSGSPFTFTVQVADADDATKVATVDLSMTVTGGDDPVSLSLYKKTGERTLKTGDKTGDKVDTWDWQEITSSSNFVAAPGDVFKALVVGHVSKYNWSMGDQPVSCDDPASCSWSAGVTASYAPKKRPSPPPGDKIMRLAAPRSLLGGAAPGPQKSDTTPAQALYFQIDKNAADGSTVKVDVDDGFGNTDSVSLAVKDPCKSFGFAKPDLNFLATQDGKVHVEVPVTGGKAPYTWNVTPDGPDPFMLSAAAWRTVPAILSRDGDQGGNLSLGELSGKSWTYKVKVSDACTPNNSIEMPLKISAPTTGNSKDTLDKMKFRVKLWWVDNTTTYDGDDDCYSYDGGDCTFMMVKFYDINGNLMNFYQPDMTGRLKNHEDDVIDLGQCGRDQDGSDIAACENEMSIDWNDDYKGKFFTAVNKIEVWTHRGGMKSITLGVVKIEFYTDNWLLTIGKWMLIDQDFDDAARAANKPGFGDMYSCGDSNCTAGLTDTLLSGGAKIEDFWISK